MSTDWPGGFYTYLDPDQSAVVDRFDVALYPEGSSGRHVYSSSHTFAIPASVSNRPAAIELLRFLTSRESQAYEAIWAGIREALLGNKSVEKALEDTEVAARRAAEGA